MLMTMLWIQLYVNNIGSHPGEIYGWGRGGGGTAYLWVSWEHTKECINLQHPPYIDPE